MPKSKKGSGAARDSKITFVLPRPDHVELRKKSKESGISVSAYLRQAAEFFRKDPRKAWDLVSRDGAGQ